MDYELAKQLKDADFPFDAWDTPCGSTYKPSYQAPNGLRYPSPTLSELIEACGERIAFKLQWVGGKWLADDRSKLGIGLTPEEAVARLWLALYGGVSA
jgi:hypothetical protein